jgi:hypothetical protein
VRAYTSWTDTTIDRRVEEFIKKAAESFDELNLTTQMLTLGLDYRRWLRFNRSTPYVVRRHDHETSFSRANPVTPQDARYGIDYVIDSALQLQVTDIRAESLNGPPPRAKRYLED